MDESQSDRELAQAAAGGDMEAFHMLVGRYGDRVIGFLYRFLNDRDRALDLAQETFLRLYQRFEARSAAAAADGSCTALIFTIAANLGRDELRRRAVRKEVPLEAAVYERPSREVSPSARLEADETHARAARALEALPADTRALLVWREMQGLSYQRIAEIMGVRLGTVKSRINRARIAFKDAYFELERADGLPAEGERDEMLGK